LIISFSLHALLLLGFFITRAKDLPKILKKTQITYRVLPSKSSEASRKETIRSVGDLHDIERPNPHNAPQGAIPVSLLKDSGKIIEDYKVYERHPQKKENLQVIRKVTVPEIKSEKINNPSYMMYYAGVREGIRQMAYHNYLQLDAGEVYLTFVLTRDGQLQNIKVLEHKSTENSYLQEVAIASVRQASPFASFPKELNYPELTFNIVISFQVDQEFAE
jgi:TonB family protein